MFMDDARASTAYSQSYLGLTFVAKLGCQSSHSVDVSIALLLMMFMKDRQMVYPKPVSSC